MSYKDKLRRARVYADRIKKKQEIYAIKHQYDSKKKIPTHKIITIYLFIILNIILTYSLVAMWYFADLTHLGVLITDIAAQVITFLIYSHHSTCQTKEGGIQYLALQHQLTTKDEELESSAVG